ncbi:MAG: DUF6745 domain-containing protein [Candidatus Obscuribacterales bacterium]
MNNPYPNIDRLATNMISCWRTALTTRTDDNPEMVEGALATLYKLSADLPPPLVLWCESPVQQMAIPMLMTNVVHSSMWDQSLATLLHAGSPESPEWEKVWDSEWIRVERLVVVPILERIWNTQFMTHGAEVQRRILSRLKSHMHTWLLSGGLDGETKSAFGLKAQSKKSNGIYPFPWDGRMFRNFATTAAKIEQRTSKEFSLNMSSTVGIVMGNFDHRIVTDRIPLTRDLLKPEDEQLEKLDRIEALKSRFEEVSLMSQRRRTWLEQVATGYTRPIEFPTMDLNRQWYEIAWDSIKWINDERVARESEARARTNVIFSSSADWLPFALTCRHFDPELLRDLDEAIDCWAYLFHGADGYSFSSQIVFACMKPRFIEADESGRPHCADGPAAVWSDGLSVYSWKGVLIDREIIEERDNITVRQILEENNAEVRRVLLDIYGNERFLTESGAEVFHEDECGILYRYEFDLDEPLMMVRVRNSTREPDGTYKFYYLRVPPTVETAREAVAWTFGLSEDEYHPEKES